MTHEQIIALIIICVSVAGLFAYAYKIGLRQGTLYGKAQTYAGQQTTIQDLEASLCSLRAEKQLLDLHCKKLKLSNALKSEHHQVLLQIAENLRIAAETFSAFKTGKKLERDARTLREQALSMAALIQPLDQEQAA
ncbi:hypothetical protein [Pseudomonas aegrilactucae]|uniref:Uncharacterized protein n=1 Tax=Pseudomonas aegrilactucae TaxID=2854028 RepID=A0A9Q2XJJ1_9PSED|nr:hypothetical protein [Pseudomonas aegrilactucae]MBV6287469.1 hypothetical protein [Pseudomonas aegrilactucae]